MPGLGNPKMNTRDDFIQEWTKLDGWLKQQRAEMRREHIMVRVGMIIVACACVFCITMCCIDTFF